jgi:pyruvate-formate lyase-activating enzyme
MDTMEKTADFLKRNYLTEITLLAYHNLGVSKKKNIGETPDEFQAPDDQHMQAIKKLFNENGLHAMIMGEKE